MSDVNLTVMGMNCSHCKTSVEKALKSVPGVEQAEVNLAEGTAKVVGKAPVEKLIAAVEEEGYSAQVR